MSRMSSRPLMSQFGYGKMSYQSPSCKVIKIASENLFCASVRPNGQTSHEQGWGAEETHNTDLFIGNEQEVAPAKPVYFIDED